MTQPMLPGLLEDLRTLGFPVEINRAPLSHEIKKQFKWMALQVHPDKAHTSTLRCGTEEMKELNAAYARLMALAASNEVGNTNIQEPTLWELIKENDRVRRRHEWQTASLPSSFEARWKRRRCLTR